MDDDAREVSSDDGSIEAELQSNGNGGLSAVSHKCITDKDIKSMASVSVTKNVAQRVQKIESEGSFVQRRVSARLQEIPENRRPFYGSSPSKKAFVIPQPKEVMSKKNAKLTHQKDKCLPKTLKLKCSAVPKDSIVSTSNAVGIGCGDSMNGGGVDGNEERRMASSSSGNGNGNGNVNVVDNNVYTKVKEKLKIFNKYYLQWVQEEEKRCKKDDVNDSKDSTPKKAVASDTNVKRPSKRPDLKAISQMLKTNADLFSKKRFGHVPGIDVGRQLFSRAEMVAVGLHSHWLFGIDYIPISYGKLENFKGYTLPLAVAVVLSGQYEDNLDKSEDVIYTGQGGNDLLGNKRQVKDQILERGNLALKNNMEQSVPVRLIRGHESVNSYSGKVYTYDGLYKVVEYWAEKGVSGFTVYKYRLRRIEGQPTLTTNQVLFARGRVCKVASKLPGLVCADISLGQEDICIPATNLFDVPPVAPEGFTYSKSIKVAENVKLPAVAPGCKCIGNCTNPKTCSCALRNGSDFPYVAKNGGRLIEAQDVVYECGPNCGCGPSCVNRTSQRGPKYRLEVFRTENKGWAVRSWDSIPSGAPVCEYIGVLKSSDEVDNVSENVYIFEIDCLQTIKEIGGRERRLRDVSLPASNHLDKDSESAPEFCLDAGSIGNVSRFINHSCEPNLFIQCVLSSYHDVRFARLVLFAAENIPPLQELTYDYAFALDSVTGSDGKIKTLPCHCGAASCRKRLH